MPVDYQIFDLAGTHYDLGHAQGARTERFGIPAWWPSPPPIDFARDCAQQIADIHAPLLDELRGYADAQGLEYDDVLRGVCRRSMRVRAMPQLHTPHLAPPTYPEGGCSSFALVGADGHVRAGRNYDFHPVQQVRQRLRLRPAQGYASVGMRGSVPGGRYDGVNDAGVFICLHVALSDEPATPRPGVPFHLLPRLVLETCANTRQAVDLLSRVRHLHPFNYLIADAGGELAVVEAHPEAVRVAQSGTDFVAATNHYRHPDLARYQHGRRLTHSQGRLAGLFAQSAELRQAGDITPALANHDSGVCGHAGGHTTLWSLKADLTARMISYARGAPCETGWEAVEWPE
jgi:Acyl-coenzyme A:6-aminopenicillanic acid acyl-transferase